jgi:hypothetical protein
MGRQGTGAGEFTDPASVVVAEGQVFVTDFDQHRVQVFDLEGQYLRGWGRYGQAAGEFKHSDGIAVSLGEVYIADCFNHRVQVFGLDGQFLRQWGTRGEGPGEFGQPRGIAVTHDRVYVTESTNNRAQVFTLAGEFVRMWGSHGAGAGEFTYPYHLAVTPTEQKGPIEIKHLDPVIAGIGGVHSVRGHGQFKGVLKLSGPSSLAAPHPHKLACQCEDLDSVTYTRSWVTAIPSG